MKRNKLWFTFVELVIVIFIVSMISIYGVSTFLTNQKKVIFKHEIERVNKTIIDFNNDIWKDITDYKINFLAWESFFTSSENELYKDNIQSISFNSWTWIITTNATGWLLEVNIYENYKLTDTQILNATWSLEYSFTWTSNYAIKSKINSAEINTLRLNRYSINTEFWASSDIILNSMTWSYEWSIYSYTGVTYKNDLTQNKEIISNWYILDDLTLYFEKDWVELNLNIKK